MESIALNKYSALHAGHILGLRQRLIGQLAEETRPVDRARFDRRLSITLFDQSAFIARPEDVILYKLRWYQITPSDTIERRRRHTRGFQGIDRFRVHEQMGGRHRGHFDSRATNH